MEPLSPLFAAPIKNMLIFIVHNSATERNLISILLRNYGYETEEAFSRADALEKIKSGASPVLIIIDYDALADDGLAFIKAAWDIDRLKNTPVLLLSDSDLVMDGIIMERVSGSLIWWLKKPYSAEELLSMVKILIF